MHNEGALQETRPNIVLILADDMGFSDIGCFGAEIETPNIDSLADNGVRFTQMYNCARCCPTRASLLTGLHPHQAGIGHMVGDLGHPSYQGYLDENCVTIAEALLDGGYRTAMAGKWHVGGRHSTKGPAEHLIGSPKYPRPIDRGFEHHYGTLAGAGSFWNPISLIEDDQLIKPDGDYYYTDRISDAAVSYIDQFAPGDEPFFLYVAYTAPHWPLQARESDIERYRGTYRVGWDRVRNERHERLVAAGVLSDTWTITPRHKNAPDWSEVVDPDWEDMRMAVYAAQVHSMDRGVGRILDALRGHGQLDDTFVFFLSDNGGCAELLREDGDYDIAPGATRSGQSVRVGNIPGLMPGPDETFMSYDLPWANASNSPFRLFKHWIHEGGIATPLVVHWPGPDGPKRTLIHEPCHVADLMPTCLEIAGVPYPTQRHGHSVTPLEGRSIAPLADGRAERIERALFWEHEGNKAIRIGDWKLVRKYPGPWELYNMEKDRTELHDLATGETVRVREMSRMHEEWEQHCDVVPWEVLQQQLGPEYKAWLQGG
jgi:arylsulfatase